LLNRDYSLASKLLHQLALRSRAVAEASFDMEQMLNKFDPGKVNESPVFIAGLARAGTTILLRSLYQTDVFRSLTYRDMPFVLMPGTWRKVSSGFRQEMTATERAHGDSIAIDYDSPEAFEEVFWRVFYGKQYIKDDYLESQILDDQACEQFRRYVASILASESASKNLRYLSKNNNNLLRLQGLKNSFPHSVIIIPFREPVQHALSLLRQHENFLNIHSEDRFSLKYMNWLGHHEFGLNHKPFKFTGNVPPTVSRHSIDYWLDQWASAYIHTLERAPTDSIFLSYEDLCQNPSETLARLMMRLNIPCSKDVAESISQAPNHSVENIDRKLLNRVQHIYERLMVVKL